MNQGRTHKQRGQLAESLRAYQEAEQIARKLNDLEMIQKCLGGQADVLLELKQNEEAERLIAEQRAIRQSIAGD